MTRDDIKTVALACGFKLKEQPDGSTDLNPYVYDFAERIWNVALESAKVEMYPALRNQIEALKK